MNKVCLSGRLMTDPYFNEYENDVKRCTIFVANDVYYGEEKATGFYKVTAWGKKAELIKQYFRTGMEIFVTGHLEQHRYEDDKGNTVYDNGVVLDEFNFGAKPPTDSRAEQVPA